MAIRSSVLAWRTSWTEEPGGLQSMDGVTKSQTRLSDYAQHNKMIILICQETVSLAIMNFLLSHPAWLNIYKK